MITAHNTKATYSNKTNLLYIYKAYIKNTDKVKNNYWICTLRKKASKRALSVED